MTAVLRPLHFRQALHDVSAGEDEGVEVEEEVGAKHAFPLQLLHLLLECILPDVSEKKSNPGRAEGGPRVVGEEANAVRLGVVEEDDRGERHQLLDETWTRGRRPGCSRGTSATSSSSGVPMVWLCGATEELGPSPSPGSEGVAPRAPHHVAPKRFSHHSARDARAEGHV